MGVGLLIHFDYDGVLVDSFGQLLRIARSVQRRLRYGRRPLAKDLHTIRNLTLAELGRTIGIPEEKIGEYAAEMFRLLRKDTRILTVWSGIPRVLNHLSNNHTLVIITANAREAVQKTLVQNGLTDCITEIFDGEIPGSKADKIVRSMKKFNFAANQTFMIGDALSDIIEGKKAGVHTIAVTWGYQPRERLVEGNPNLIVEKPAGLLKIFPSNDPKEFG
jgi:phosphoglycolate phosphatase